MIKLSRQELEKIIGVQVTNYKGKFEGIEFDNRNIKGGELFIGLKGEHTHGQEFSQKALDIGASLVLVESQELAEKNPEQVIAVSDTLVAFQKLAGFWREKIGTKIIGVTGSVGKTTIKEMCASILLEYGRGYYSLKSHNNHTGVPYTLSKLSSSHLWAVVEIGMNKAGEISNLSNLVKPEVGVICNVVEAHIQSFASIAEIADAKAEIILNIKDTLIANADNQELLAGIARTNHHKKMSTYGYNGSELKLLDIQTCGLSGILFQFEFENKKYECKLNIIGKHNAINACGAILACKTLIPELAIEMIIKGLERFQSPYMRLQHFRLRNGREIVDDSYNANPASMKALLELAGELSDYKIGLVLGDMLELGEGTQEYHQKVAVQAVGLRPEFIVYLGENYPLFEKEAKLNNIKVFSAENPEMAANLVSKLAANLVMIKGSRGVGLERCVRLLVEQFGLE